MTTVPPVIDISGLASPLLADRKAVAAKIGDACRAPGFFYVTGHDIDAELLAAMFAASKQFFGQSLEAKRAMARTHGADNRGYVERERLDLGAAPDRKEAFNIGLELADDDPDRIRYGRGENAWPDLPGWRQLMLDYYNRCWSLGLLLHRAFSLDLGIAEEYFEDKLDRPLATLRLLHYPGRAADQDLGPGAGAHTDYGNLTLLIGDGVDGLQIRPRGGNWTDAPHVPGAFICNIGDCLMRWSNDTYVSTPHRVQVPERDRYSIAFFLDPNPDAVVEPIIGRFAEAPKYPAITGLAYLESRLNPTYAFDAE